MFISLVKVITTNISDEQIVHSAILQLFNSNRETSGVLYKQLGVGTEGELIVAQYLVYSKTSPKPVESLPEPFLYTVEIEDSKEIEPHFKEGVTLRFSTWLNPVRRNRETKNCYLINNPEERREWFENKMKNIGATVISYQEKAQKTICFNKHDMQGKYVGILYEGKLRVDAPETFLENYVNGIGKGKAYGLGLISLARA